MGSERVTRPRNGELEQVRRKGRNYARALDEKRMQIFRIN